MYELMVESKFSAAHQLRGYQGQCEKLHGHNWRVTVAVTAERLDEQGLAIDFHQLKKALREILDQLEHTFLNDIFPFTQINPSSENLAKWIYDNMTKKVNDDNIEVASVTAAVSHRMRTSNDPRIAIHAAAGAIPRANPSTRCEKLVNRFVKE